RRCWGHRTPRHPRGCVLLELPHRGCPGWHHDARPGEPGSGHELERDLLDPLRAGGLKSRVMLVLAPGAISPACIPRAFRPATSKSRLRSFVVQAGRVSISSSPTSTKSRRIRTRLVFRDIALPYTGRGSTAPRSTLTAASQ